MAIENSQQLKHYVNTLPWYKKIFFPRALFAFFNAEYFDRETDEMPKIVHLSKIYHELRASMLGFFYHWLFPELACLVTLCKQQVGISPSGVGLMLAITNREYDEIKRIVNLPRASRPDSEALINALILSIKANYLTYALMQKHVYDVQMVSRAFVLAINDKEWRAITTALTLFPFLQERLNVEASNHVFLSTASAHKMHELTELFKLKCIAQKLTVTTVSRALSYILSRNEYEHDSDLSLLKSLLDFKDADGVGLGADAIETAYLQAVKNGRVNSLKLIQALPNLSQAPMELIIEAVKEAAEHKYYNMVLHLLQMIPSDRRLEVVQTKARFDDNEPIRYVKDSKCTNILQWAVGYYSTENIQPILDALSEPERYLLMTQSEDYYWDSAPILTTVSKNYARNLNTLLNALSPEHLMETILPKKPSIDMALSRCDKRTKHNEVLPILLNRIFGDNQRLYAAYNALETRMSENLWKTLYAMRDYYLSVHAPSMIQRRVSFFQQGFSIPGHTLSNQELDLVVRAVFYRHYGQFDHRQRGAIEARVDAYDRLVEADAPASQVSIRNDSCAGCTEFGFGR